MKNINETNKSYTLDANNTFDQAIDTLGHLVEHGIEESCENDLLANDTLIENAIGKLDTSMLTLENLQNDGRVELLIEKLLNHVIGAYQMAEDDV